MITLSNRLARIASYVPTGVKTADIGSDHAFLPIHLAQSGKSVYAVAGELNLGPFKAAERNVRQQGLTDRVSVRRGDGLAVIEPGEVDVITVSGMGGGTIKEILAADTSKLQGVSRLVLSPQGDADTLRRWLLEQGWQIVDEDLLIEDDKLYEFVVAERGEMKIDNPLALEFGPLLLARKHPLLVERLDYEIGKLDRALQGVEKATGPAAEARKQELLARKSQLEEVKSSVQP
ncbi:MAG TPA: class I SAM-dependent methyltransferase [Bacilli bacterium]|nr:class I SAM-dependent methyltransferase [Bacilli bacterium]